MTKERPILFNGDMVRAILEGRKMQTRRRVSPQPRNDDALWPDDEACMEWWEVAENASHYAACGWCPYGGVGARLWVRESIWAAHAGQFLNDPARPEYVQYVADDPKGHNLSPDYWKKVPSIHMPRWASRLTLEIIGVRLERLQDITEEDAMAEGVASEGGRWKDYQLKTLSGEATARDSFKSLWDSINGRGAWDANPWVWVMVFKQMQKTDEP